VYLTEKVKLHSVRFTAAKRTSTDVDSVRQVIHRIYQKESRSRP